MMSVAASAWLLLWAVALIGYSFMGRAHSNAYRQVAPFFAEDPFTSWHLGELAYFCVTPASVRYRRMTSA